MGCSSWGRKESDMTKRITLYFVFNFFLSPIVYQTLETSSMGCIVAKALKNPGFTQRAFC